MIRATCYRQKLARITLDSMVQFVGLLDAKGTVLEISHVALDAVGVKLAEVQGRPFWTTFWWQVSDEIMDDNRFPDSAIASDNTSYAREQRRLRPHHKRPRRQ